MSIKKLNAGNLFGRIRYIRNHSKQRLHISYKYSYYRAYCALIMYMFLSLTFSDVFFWRELYFSLSV